MIMRASVGSRTKKDNPAAKMSMSMIGLLNWASKRVRVSDRFFGLKRLGPCCLRRSWASVLVKPSGVVSNCQRSSGGVVLQNASGDSFIVSHFLVVRALMNGYEWVVSIRSRVSQIGETIRFLRAPARRLSFSLLYLN